VSAEGLRKVKVQPPIGQTATLAAHDGQPAPLVAHIFPTFAVGGAQVRFAAIANHFGPAFRHIVVALDGNLECRERLSLDLDAAFPTVAAAKHAMLSNAWHFRKMLRDWRPDVLVTCNWGAIEFALANILPVTRHMHVVDGFGPEERTTQIPRRVLIRRIALSRTPVVLPSRNLVRIATEVWKLPPKVIRYVPNGVDLARFATDGSGRGSPEPVIGTVAALREEKNVARLLRAFATLPSGRPVPAQVLSPIPAQIAAQVPRQIPAQVRSLAPRLVIVGDGPQRPALEALAASLGVSERVSFVGHHRDTAAFYAQFDVFALSSDTEQMPLSVIEAMASGLPVVSTDVGDVRLMVAGENLSHVTRLDDAALAAALAALIADPEARRRAGLANLAKARRDFDQAAMFATYAELWRGQDGARRLGAGSLPSGEACASP